eukprot:1260735-Pyramimonas_sp.AAC.1
MHVVTTTEAFAGLPYGATERVRVVPKLVAGTHVVTATEVFGATYEAREGCRMWSQPLKPSVELSMWGAETRDGGCRHGWRERMWSQPLGPS